jgi:hypothetical protein
MARFEEYLKAIADDFAKNSLIEPGEFPEIPLYADQVAEFFRERLGIYAGHLDISKGVISDYVKKDLIPQPDKKRFDKDLTIMVWFILFLKMAYGQKDVEAIMKPFVENIESRFDEKFNFTEIYEKLKPVFREQRRESADRAANTAAAVKDVIRG